MNRAWHDRHPEPGRATAEMRLRWHMAHQNACGCTPIPASLFSALAAAPRRASSKKPKNRKR